MPSLFCCASIQPYRPQRLDHEAKFSTFMTWAQSPEADISQATTDEPAAEKSELKATYIVQFVRQVNYGPLESKRYFAAPEGEGQSFIEVTEEDLIQANFQKLNSYVC